MPPDILIKLKFYQLGLTYSIDFFIRKFDPCVKIVCLGSICPYSEFFTSVLISIDFTVLTGN